MACYDLDAFPSGAFPGGDPNNRNLCWMKACGDGFNPEKDFPERLYCGVGLCNPFGCDCDGGCIPGEAWAGYAKRFERSKGLVTFVKYDDSYPWVES